MAEAALDRVISLTLGCVGQIGTQGGPLALVSKLHANLPTAMTSRILNNYCVSGLTAARQAALEAAAAIDDRLRLAGGVEMMSIVPFPADHAHHHAAPDTARALRHLPVPLSADRMATMEGISREALDTITVRSHERAAQAW